MGGGNGGGGGNSATPEREKRRGCPKGPNHQKGKLSTGKMNLMGKKNYYEKQGEGKKEILASEH